MPPIRRRSPHRRRRIFTLTAAAAAVIVVTGAGVLTAANTVGCTQLADGAIIESQQFTPADQILSGFPDAPINPDGAPVPLIPTDAQVASSVVEEMPLRWAITISNGAVYQYFSGKAIGPELTTGAFLADGGIQYLREPAADGSFAAYLLTELGERATSTQIGEHDGALTWADPLPNGVRTHNVYWSDGAFNYALIADRSAVALVNLARGMACGTA